MKKYLKILSITIFLSVISFFGISNTKALRVNANGFNLDLPDFTYYNHYIILYSDIGGGGNNSNFRVFASTLSNPTFSAQTNSIFISSSNPYGITNLYNRLNGSVNSFSRIYNLINGEWVLQSGTNYGNTVLCDTYNSCNGFIVYTTDNIYKLNNSSNIFYNAGYIVPSDDIFQVDYEQGEVIISNSGGNIANLFSYYIKPFSDNINLEDYHFTYSYNAGGGFRESIPFNLSYWENGINVNNVTYYYYFNLPLSFNSTLTFNIYNSDDELVQSNEFNAYLSSLISLTGYIPYDFRNYEFANMSSINSGSFGISHQLLDNVTINVINYIDGTKTNFINSTYNTSVRTGNNGITWYDFDFNNEPIYLEFINLVNDDSDFLKFIDKYNLYLYFPENAYVHLSASPTSLDNQNLPSNQQSYKDENGNIVYEDNIVVYNPYDSNNFFNNLNDYFKDFDSNTFGLTGIITSPLYLIQNLSSSSCSNLSIPLPYINSNLTLPCMSSIYSQFFGSFFTLYQNITFGVVAYWVIVKYLNLIKDFRSPDHDEIEVLDL